MFLCFDPGMHTGWCLADKEGKLIEYGQTESGHEVLALILNRKPKVVIYESFHLMPAKAMAQIGSTFPAAETIGVIRVGAAQVNAELVRQPPTLKRFFRDRKRIETYGYRIKGSDHILDAARHLLYYLVFKRKIMEVKDERGQDQRNRQKGGDQAT